MNKTSSQLVKPIFDTTDIESEEPQMESDKHYEQLDLLYNLKWLWAERDDYYVGANLSIYYNQLEPKKREFIGPDFFLVKNVSAHPRKSWMTWKENNRFPDLIVEVLSDSTRHIDKKKKKEFYQNFFQTPEYFLFDPDSLEFSGFRLVNGKYEEIQSDEKGLKWSEVLGLYFGIYEDKLRYFSPQGALVPTPEESSTFYEQQAKHEKTRADNEKIRAEKEKMRADNEKMRAEKEKMKAESERMKTEKLIAQLRALGIEPEV